MNINVIRPGENTPARVLTFDQTLPTDNMVPQITASLSSPTFSYTFDTDVNDPSLVIVQHPLPYPDRLKASSGVCIL